jgi:hypothetical protein
MLKCIEREIKVKMNFYVFLGNRLLKFGSADSLKKL